MGRRIAPTKNQQLHLRAKMMNLAAKCQTQIQQYLDDGVINVSGNEYEVTNERINVWKLVFSKSLPDEKDVKMTHTTGLEELSQGELLSKLADMVQQRPDLAKRLNEVVGGKLIEGTVLKDN